MSGKEGNGREEGKISRESESNRSKNRNSATRQLLLNRGEREKKGEGGLGVNGKEGREKDTGKI